MTVTKTRVIGTDVLTMVNCDFHFCTAKFVSKIYTRNVLSCIKLDSRKVVKTSVFRSLFFFTVCTRFDLSMVLHKLRVDSNNCTLLNILYYSYFDSKTNIHNIMFMYIIIMVYYVLCLLLVKLHNII